MDISSVRDISDLNDWLQAHHLRGFWEMIGEQTRPPEFKPFLWKWEDIYSGLTKAAEIVSMDGTGIQTGRRNLSLVNPRMNEMPSPITLGIQCLLPGEVARAHRHTPAAIRFVVKGSRNAYTVVEGEPMPMEEGDLITTPSWTWHDHYNQGPEPVVWLDGLDVGLSRLARSFREDFQGDQQPRDKPVGYAAKVLGPASPPSGGTPYPLPPYRYAWTETSATLQLLKETEQDLDPHDGYRLLYKNPVTGGPTVPTFSCEIHLLPTGFQARSHRHNSTTRYQVFRGSGRTVVEGERLEWSQGDMFVVPPWLWHQHENQSDGDAILFAMTDWPTINALGLYREESQ